MSQSKIVMIVSNVIGYVLVGITTV